MEEVEERVSTLEAVLGQFIVQTEKVLMRMERDTATFKKEIRHDQQQRNEYIQLFQEEVRRDQVVFRDTMN